MQAVQDTESVKHPHNNTTLTGRLFQIAYSDLAYKQRKSVVKDMRLITQNLVDARIEKVKRKSRYGEKGQWVNGNYYPATTRYGYRFTGIPSRLMTIGELRELQYNLTQFLQSEKE